uniref:Piezo non-specific cation channel R-Ras-binding domain-containing protein n=1 Tax=Plectus sambesii TaxID=2011161 RepID=A0A914XP34_9BILA
MTNGSINIEDTFADLNMSLIQSGGNRSIWSGQMDVSTVNSNLTVPLEDYKVPSASPAQHYMQMVAFVDKVFPTWLTKAVSGGIIAMYLAVVLLIGRAIRGLVTNAPLDVIISEMPNVDHLLKICHDIYLVREARDFELEEDLFAKLIFLFRSPATLIKWTRLKIKRE